MASLLHATYLPLQLRLATPWQQSAHGNQHMATIFPWTVGSMPPLAVLDLLLAISLKKDCLSCFRHAMDPVETMWAGHEEGCARCSAPLCWVHPFRPPPPPGRAQSRAHHADVPDYNSKMNAHSTRGKIVLGRAHW